MNVASLELCKELYDLSGWADVNYAWNTGNGRVMRLYVDDGEILHRDDYPAYDLGYLLRRLPIKAPNLKGSVNYWFTLTTIHTGEWMAWYDGTAGQAYGNSPEDAAAKLAIKLFKQGILVKENNVTLHKEASNE